MKGSRAAVLLLPLALAGCATRGSVNRVRQEIGALGKGIDELRRAQEQSGQELASLVRELKAGDVRLAQLGPEVAANAEAVRNLSARLDQAEQALARMRAQADNAARDSPRVSGPGVAAAHERTRAPDPPPRPDAPEQAYTAALEVFHAREYGQAVLDFIDFVTRYPKHRLASNAQYWIGEAYYVQRDYRQAALEFQKVIDADARGAKVPDALLKIGLCYVSLHQPTRAREVWQQVVQAYPDSDAARKARSLIRARGASFRRSR